MRITPEDFNAWIASQRQTPARPSTPLRAADRAPRAAAAGSFRALVHADTARAAGTTAQVQDSERREDPTRRRPGLACALAR